ncbi:hypothetical protein GQ457_08G025990 [Hibiscus cannabinus]
MTADGNNQLISVQPNGLKFVFELEKPSFCDLKVVNNTQHHVAFKVKTTSPKKYFVRPNTGVVQPWDSSAIRVTLQAQREYPLDMQCKDKFLLQSTVVPANTDVDDLPADTFNKESGREIQECKLKVLYVTPSSRGNSEDEGFKSYPEHGTDSNSTVQQLKEERDAAVRQTLQLQQELVKLYHPHKKLFSSTVRKQWSGVLVQQDFLKRRRQRRNEPGFSLMFAFAVGVIGILVGLLLNVSFSSSSSAFVQEI